MWKYFCYAAGLIFGAIMLFGGAFILQVMPSLFAERINTMLPITKGSESWKRYTGASVPIKVKLYMFNVTNPEEVERGAKPILNQVGPFALSESRKREILSVSPDNKTLDFKLFRTYFYNQNESISLDSVITLPNAPAFGAFFGAGEKDRDDGTEVASQVASTYLANETVLLTYTARQWLFDGIKLKWLDGLNDDGVIFPDQPPDNTFGFYYKKNNSWDEKADGILTVWTAADGDIKRIGQVVKWNKEDRMTYWRGNPCNSLRGTEGQFFHPFVKKEDKLEIFAPDLCRSLTVEYKRTASLRTIELYRYGLSESFFKPILSSEDTKCFCVKRTPHERQKFCNLGGVMDVSSCRKKPIVLSTPHFYNGDSSLRDAVGGMQPSAAQHDTSIDVEPITGLVLRVKRRLQVNVEMTAYRGFNASQIYKNQRLIMPMIWLDQQIEAPDEAAQKLENKLTKTIRMIKILSHAALIIGPLILVATLIFICRDIRSEDKKLKGARKSRDAGGDYKKVDVIMKPINSNNNTTTNK